MPRVASFAKSPLEPWPRRPMLEVMSALYMDAVIRPNRSLSRRGFYWVIGIIAAFNLAVATLMIVLRAFPVPIFLGADLVAVTLAFMANYRSGGLSERVQVSAAEVRVLHQTGTRSRTIWSSPTAFTQVAVELAGEPETRVRLRLSGRALTVAHALSPAERADFAEALRTAIRQARAERY